MKGLLDDEFSSFEGIVDEFCLIFSSIKAVSLQLGRDVAK